MNREVCSFWQTKWQPAEAAAGSHMAMTCLDSNVWLWEGGSIGNVANDGGGGGWQRAGQPAQPSCKLQASQISQHDSSLLRAAGITYQSTRLEPLASCSRHQRLVNMAQASWKLLQASHMSQHGSTPLPAAAGITALFNPKTSISIQTRHPYTGNLNSETSEDSQNAFLYCGDIF